MSDALAYIRNDCAALTLMGSKKWWNKPHLIRFGVDVCDLTRKQALTLYQECTQALGKVNHEVALRRSGEEQETYFSNSAFSTANASKGFSK